MGIKQQNNISEDLALRKIMEGTAAHTGEEFFQALVKNLSEVLNTKGHGLRSICLITAA